MCEKISRRGLRLVDSQRASQIDYYSALWLLNLLHSLVNSDDLLRSPEELPLKIEQLNTLLKRIGKILRPFAGEEQIIIERLFDKTFKRLFALKAMGVEGHDILGGKDPYSASKASAEILFSSYARSYLNAKQNFSCASARAGNVIGGGDYSTDRIIPDCVRAAQSDGKVVIRNPNATRPWQHVLEPLSGYLLLGKALFEHSIDSGSAWNFGPSAEKVITVENVTNRVFDILGSGTLVIDADDDHPHEAGLLQLNCDKAHAYLGWKPKWSGESAIEKTALWYRDALSGQSIEEITSAQIEDYFNEN